jgi:hypothetical protein
MKKQVILLRAILTIMFAFIVMVPYGFAQNLQGTWEVSVSGNDRDWTWVTEKLKGEFTIYIYQDDSVEPNEPNLTIITPDDPNDPFSGYVRDNRFWFFKHNTHAENFGGPNIGAEQIAGNVKVPKKSITLTGKGHGFDSNPEWGSSWNYAFKANKISSNVP